nr:hypothetical protein [Desulfovibrio sp.]
MEKHRFPHPSSTILSRVVLPGIVLALVVGCAPAQDACASDRDMRPVTEELPVPPRYVRTKTTFPIDVKLRGPHVQVYDSIEDMPEDLRRIWTLKGVENRSGRPVPGGARPAPAPRNYEAQTRTDRRPVPPPADSRLDHPAGAFPVPMSRLANATGIRKNMTQDQFRQAYDAAVRLVTPFAGMPRERQLQEVMKALRAMFESPGFRYSTSAPHYNDPYGYFVLRVSSCAGCARTTILCLNILGIPCEHVNPNKWRHQWARVKVG